VAVALDGMNAMAISGHHGHVGFSGLSRWPVRRERGRPVSAMLSGSGSWP
jgi:hypothetical protein